MGTFLVIMKPVSHASAADLLGLCRQCAAVKESIVTSLDFNQQCLVVHAGDHVWGVEAASGQCCLAVIALIASLLQL